ncbi:VOC family protein [Lichenicoccus roseus]|uniref:VOC family protein n=1 Tax=Lichenicoccus roseus TaxID=2683649 RepID=A0A5R9JDH3_9PROT|nr:VOC family protein [Lichenicoccus roseus]TLU72338.1 VOC family protein [Lichenicoccus roseus]
MRFTVDRLDHIVITCRDVEITASWYQRVLGMEREEYGRNNRSALKFGGQKVNLRPYGSEGWITADDAIPGCQDLCFVTAVRTEDIIEHLQTCGVTVTEGPVERLGALGPTVSVYCHDPDGNLIELACYAG